MWQQIIEWLESYLLKCHFNSLFGINCFGCGMQRAIIALLKGDIIESIEQYPALIPMIALFIYLFLHLIFHFKNGAKILKILFIFCLFIIIISYIYKSF